MKKKIIGVMLSAMMLTVTILSGCSSTPSGQFLKYYRV